MDKEIILIGGASASGKTTFVNNFVNNNSDYFQYRRTDAFKDVAEERNIPYENRFKSGLSAYVDDKVISMIYEKNKLIHDIHYALQRGRDFDDGNLETDYVSPISDYFIRKLQEYKIRIIAAHIICSESDLYNRAVMRYERGERELRAKSIEDALVQREWERKLWIELCKTYGLENIELNSSLYRPNEMVEIMNNKILSKKMI